MNTGIFLVLLHYSTEIKQTQRKIQRARRNAMACVIFGILCTIRTHHDFQRDRDPFQLQ